MKRNLLWIVLITLLIISCGTVANSPQGSSGCFRDKERELCVTIRAEKDVVLADEVLPLTITVTSSQDEQKLQLWLTTAGYADFMKGIQFPGQEIIYEDNLNKGWEFDTRENQTITFNGSVTFSEITAFNGEYGVFDILVLIIDPIQDVLVSNSLKVYFGGNGGRVYYANTQIPITPELIIEETVIGYTYTPGPFPTWAPSATWYPEIATREALTQQAAKTPQPEQTAKP